MVLQDQYKIKKTGNSYILYDASILLDPALILFNTNQQGGSSFLQSSQSPAAGIGRANVIYFVHDENKLVLKHYYRGGLVASIVKDKYLGLDIENTRAFKEWRLLKKMQQLGLAVPEAVAAHVEKYLFFYRADLITREIENAETLADVLIKQAINADSWRKIGACIKSFHQHDVYHSDLNARNVLLVDSLQQPGDVYLIDFDNSYIRSDTESWKLANLARLKRSLLKFKKNVDGFNFSDTGWSALLDGYG